MTIVTNPKNDISVYFVNKYVDFICIGGFSIILFCVFYSLEKVFAIVPATSWAFMLVMSLQWVVNYPHFAATSYRLYRSKDTALQYPLTSFVIPITILVVVIACFMLPKDMSPYLLKLYFIWSFFHYSGQTMGISLLYSKRAGIALNSFERWSFFAFIYSTFAAITTYFDTVRTRGDLFHVTFPSLGLPPILNQISQMATGISLLCLAASIVSRYLRKEAALPWIGYLPSLSQLVWFIPGQSVMIFTLFIPLFHSLQYLLIAWAMQMKESQVLASGKISHSVIIQSSAKWFISIIAGGVVMFYFLPHAATLFGVPYSVTLPVIWVALQIHHFFVDGVIWKLRSNPTLSQTAMNTQGVMS